MIRGDFTSDTSGSFTSPRYPVNYPNDASCTWLIQGEAGKVISVTFTDFDLEDDETCRYDVMQAYEGVGTNGTLLLEWVSKILLFACDNFYFWP